jgi:hypothetical protein
MFICEGIDIAMQRYSFLDATGIVKSFLSFDKIAYDIAHKNFRLIKGEPGMSKVIHATSHFY